MDSGRMEKLEKFLTKLIQPENLVDDINDIGDTEKEEFYRELEEIYEGEFRHQYSLISSFLEAQSADVYPSLNIWLRALAQYGETRETQEIAKKVKKLLDHVELEIIRLDRMKAVRRLAEESREIKKQMEDDAELTEEAVKEVKNNIEKYHEQSVSILSIFSAVVLAFMGGISFSSGVLNSIASASMFRLIITILLLGFVLFNSVFILLRCVMYIIRKKEAEKFKSGIFWFNAILIGILVAVIVAYNCGFGSKIEEWGQIPPLQSASATVSVE